MHIVKQCNGKFFAISTKEMHPAQMKSIKSKLANLIMAELAKNPSYPLAIAKKLGVCEQKVYYHIRNLVKEGFLKKVSTELKNGIALNYYAPVTDSYFVRFGDNEKSFGSEYACAGFFSPFIKNGKFNALLVLGSPEAHGPEKAKARDTRDGVEFAFFLGTLLNNFPSSAVKFDTEITKEDLKKNLIVIGGPVVNKITDMLNKHLPIYFDKKNKWAITSKFSKKTYSNDECGLIVRLPNPFFRNSSVMVIGGKRMIGTKAAIFAIMNRHHFLLRGNAYSPENLAYVIEGADKDSDGKLDSVDFKE